MLYRVSYACEGSGGGVPPEPDLGVEPSKLVSTREGGVPCETRECALVCVLFGGEMGPTSLSGIRNNGGGPWSRTRQLVCTRWAGPLTRSESARRMFISYEEKWTHVLSAVKLGDARDATL